jgi:hypothetical protein
MICPLLSSGYGTESGQLVDCLTSCAWLDVKEAKCAIFLTATNLKSVELLLTELKDA